MAATTEAEGASGLECSIPTGGIRAVEGVLLRIEHGMYG
jgi:hypothetical protein